ncbi:hypothetical protein [Streptomyces sp. ODS05-4]|uniref:hypothetical protein n=1 Tax=Streptomyces sp. ODS05-4 TaxID=2944939 RepID=UPI00210EFB9A|nr:hypothetical protein [Streptomyces sp. ODS05-4]
MASGGMGCPARRPGKSHRAPGFHTRDLAAYRVATFAAIWAKAVRAPVPMGDRAVFSFALVSVAVVVDLDGDGVRDTRVAFGGLATKPWRARRVESALRGGPATADRFAAVASAELSAARTVRADAYKVPLARDTLVATLLDACGRGRGGRRASPLGIGAFAP